MKYFYCFFETDNWKPSFFEITILGIPIIRIYINKEQIELGLLGFVVGWFYNPKGYY